MPTLSPSPTYTLTEKIARYAHVVQLSELYDGCTVTFSVALTAEKSAIKAVVNTAVAAITPVLNDADNDIDAFIAANPAHAGDANLANAKTKINNSISALTTMQTNHTSTVDTQLDAADTDILVTDILSAILSDIETKRSTELTYTCVRCNTKGSYPYNRYQTSSGDTTEIICKSCKGHGAASVEIQNTNPVHTEMEETVPTEP